MIMSGEPDGGTHSVRSVCTISLVHTSVKPVRMEPTLVSLLVFGLYLRQ